MGHKLHVIIGPKASVTQFTKRWCQTRQISLPQDFAMVPLTAVLHDDITELANVKKPDPFEEFERLSAGVETVLRAASWAGPLAYIETDYFGGCGTQSAIAWNRGNLLAGPFKTVTEWDGSDFVTNPLGERAINQVLAALGVWTRGDSDQFDMLGLGKFRDTESVAKK